MNLKAWIMASRPKTLTAALAPVAVGTAIAHAQGMLSWTAAAAALLGAIAIQLGTNFANDAYDFQRGADTEERLGPTRAVQAGLLSASQIKRGTLVAFAMATLFGLYLVYAAGPWVIAIGVLSVISGLAYTAGPYPLAYLGLGDVFVMIFFGLVAVAGTTFVQTGAFSSTALLSGVGVGALSTAILVVNNKRDRVQDLAAQKMTLAARFGARFANAEYVAMIVLGYGVPALLFFLGMAQAKVFLPMISLPLALRATWRACKLDGADLNPVLGETARLLLLYGLLLAGGLW